MMMRRLRSQRRAAYRVSPYSVAVSPVVRACMRARSSSRRTRLSSRRLPASPSTYSTSAASRKASSLESVKPASARTRSRARGKTVRSLVNSRRSSPRTPRVAAPHGVLEPRQGRLRPQARAVERIAVEQQLVDRVVDQPRGVVAVGVATGQPEDALPQQIPERVRHLAGLATVADGSGLAPGQTEPIVDRLQQNGAAVGTGLRLVEPGDDRLRNPVDPEGAVRYTGCGHRASAFECREASRHRFYSTCAWLGGSSLSLLVNFPG